MAYQAVPQGPKAKQLSLGKVPTNNRDDQSVLVQPYESQWMFVKIVHVPLYQSREGTTTEPTGMDAVDTVRYAALVKTVQLLRE